MLDNILRKGSPTSLAQRTFRGFNWTFLSAVLQSVLVFLFGIILARLIPPEDFGLLGMAMIFTGIAGLFSNLGIGPAIIQRRSLTTAHIRVAVTLSTILGSILTLVLWNSAGSIALLYGDYRISPILKLISLSFLLNGLSSTSRSLLHRTLQFKKLFFIEIAANIFGYFTLSIPMAILDYGVWSLVFGMLFSSTISCVLLVSVARPSLIPFLRKKEIGELIGFGTGMTLISITNYAATHVDYFIIGKMLSARDLGLYARAYQLMLLPLSRFAGALTTVLFPAYAELQNETNRISLIYFKAVSADGDCCLSHYGWNGRMCRIHCNRLLRA
ncbi:MAG: lipopolysaccharide biosynthesis protein [Deltaproteobacteria bacterium]|nr:lipopolysaccharide biosynthesis protein [Deltaproteobacteria bacterium]